MRAISTLTSDSIGGRAANATILKDLQHIIVAAGYEMPVICTPEELIGD